MLRASFLQPILILFILILSGSKPIGYTQVNEITNWWPTTAIAKSIGVPGYADTQYTHFAFGIWTCGNEIGSMAMTYSHPLSTFGSNFLGTTDEAIRKELKKRYSQAGVKLILLAFADSQYPIRFGVKPLDCAKKLADDVKKYEFDGVDIDFQDNYALEQGIAEEWLISFTKKLR